jgi:alpha-L-fucosidase
MKPLTVFLIFTVFSIAFFSFAHAAEQGDIGYKPSDANLEARKWFQDVKFGLFVHWGVYSVHGRGEWVMNQEKINITDYEKLPPQFNPVRFDPDEWCRMAKNAGMKYITITSKHHDGFAMWDSGVSDYDIIDRTPYKKDVLKMLSDACERHGLTLFFYHSQLDWHHPDYYPRGRTGKDYTGRKESGNWNAYLDYMDAQLSELCSNYGKIGGIWFDGMWDKPDVDWRLGKTYSMIHNIRPDIMVGSNHHVTPFPGEDFQMFEKGLPGKDPFSKKGHVSVLPLETCETLNKSCGYNKTDKEFKSTKELVQYLAKAAGNNANFLLNVGPMPDGSIQPEFRERLAEMGNWVRANGESVYNTRGGPVPPQDWGVTTHRGKNTVYLHLLSETIDRITVPDMVGKVKYARLLNGTVVEFEEASSGTVFRIPEDFRDPYDTVIVVTLGE